MVRVLDRRFTELWTMVIVLLPHISSMQLVVLFLIHVYVRDIIVKMVTRTDLTVQAGNLALKACYDSWRISRSSS